MINMQLAIDRKLSDSEIKLLNALHSAVTYIAYIENTRFLSGEKISKRRLKELRRNVKYLEYLMQDLWEFPRDKNKHTHWRRFYYLVDLNHGRKRIVTRSID